MPKLLAVTTVAGTHRAFLLPYARHFRGLGWKVDGMAAGITRCPECVEAYDSVFENTWSRTPLHPANLTRAAAAVRRVVDAGDYDLVHVHTPVAAFVTRYALRGLRRRGRPKIIYTAHGFHFHPSGHPVKNAAFVALERLAGRWTDFLIVINRWDEEAARRYGLVPQERLRYMPGIGIDLRVYSPWAVSIEDVERVRHEIGLRDGQVMFLMVAEFIKRKRHLDVVRALGLLGRKEIILAFAGEGPTMEEVRKETERLGVVEQVRFLGYRRDVPALMLASRATVLPSGQEGLPRAVMESMALGVPVIGAAARGTQELLERGGGWLVPIGDVEALAKAMAFVADHPEEAARMGQRAAEAVKEYDLERILDLHAQLYEEALALR